MALRAPHRFGYRARFASVDPQNALTPHHAPRRAALAFIFVTVLLDMLAFGIIIPVLPHLVEQLIGGGTASAAWWVGVLSTVFAITQFIFSPIQGALSDRYGRRPVILISNFGLAIDFFVLALAPTLWLLFVGRTVMGMTAASFSTANAYIADITPKEKRAGAYGLLGAAFGVGFVLGPGLGGWLGAMHLRLPFYVAGSLALCNFLYGLFVLPESLPPERRSARFELHSAHPIGALKLLRRTPQLLGMGVASFLVFLAHYALQITFVLYADYRYHWGTQSVGLVLMLVGACDGLVQALLTRRLTPRFGERPVLLFGMLCGIASFALMGLATEGWMFLLGIPLMALWGLSNPPIQSIMTRQVEPSEQGRLQGANTSLGSFAGIFGPYLFAQVFAWSIAPASRVHVPGAAFLLAAGLLAGALLVAVRATRGGQLEPSGAAPADPAHAAHAAALHIAANDTSSPVTTEQHP